MVRTLDLQDGKTLTLLDFRVQGLQPRCRYSYQFVLNGEPDVENEGQVKTLPRPGQRASLTFGVGSCCFNQNTRLNPKFPYVAAFRALVQQINNEGLDLFIHLGDLFYFDKLLNGSTLDRLKLYESVLGFTPYTPFFSSTNICYLWDDHDFLGNNRGGGDPEYNPAARTALNAYEMIVPHYPLVSPEFGCTQAYTFGRVRFICTDTRFCKSSYPPRSVLGRSQLDWLFSEFAEAKNYDLVVWTSSIPWIAPSREGADSWGGYAKERKLIADRIAELKISNLIMIAGDGHMLAIDNGDNNRFSTLKARGFPVFHAGALDSEPSVKGGPYSQGTVDQRLGPGIPGTGQFGLVEVSYESSSGFPKIDIRLSGLRAVQTATDNRFKTEELISLDLTWVCQSS